MKHLLCISGNTVRHDRNTVLRVDIKQLLNGIQSKLKEDIQKGYSLLLYIIFYRNLGEENEKSGNVCFGNTVISIMSWIWSISGK